jgi:hypothetical protein
MPSWAFAVTNRTGALAASLEPEQARVTVRLSGHAELAAAVDARSPAAVEIIPAAAAIRAWRDGILRFNGQVVEPVDRGLDLVTFRACDPFYFLSNRRRETQRVFAATDAGAIARALVNDERARETLHLRNAATFPTSVVRDRTYERGKQIGEAIRELADARDGFFFRIDPVDAGADMGELVILYPSSGADRPAAVFYSTDSGANIDDPHEILGLPRTRVVTVGAQNPATGTPLLGEAQDTTARATYGLIEDEIAYTDVTETGLLNALALEALHPQPPRAYKVSPIAHGDDGHHVPALWDDFTVGDRVRLRIRRNAIDVDTWARVTEVTLAISDQGRTERIDSLLLEAA